jgi:hypothetical protein
MPTVIPKKATIHASRRGTQLTTEVFTRTIMRSSSPIRDERRTNNVKEIASNRLSVVFTQLSRKKAKVTRLSPLGLLKTFQNLLTI